MSEYVEWPRQRTKNYQENLEISSTSSENESEVDDSKEEQAKAAKEKWFDKHEKSKRKRSSLLLNEIIEPIVLRPQLKDLKYQKFRKTVRPSKMQKRKLGK